MKAMTSSRRWLHGQRFTIPSKINALPGAIGASLLLIALWCAPLQAQFIWNGGGGDSNFSTGENWDGGSAPGPANYDGLTFAGAINMSPTADQEWSVGSIIFDTDAGAFTLGGSLLNQGGGIYNNSSSLQTINNDIVIEGYQEFVASSGALTFNGAITLADAEYLDLRGDDTITINGVISGDGLLDPYENVTVILTAANTFTGVVELFDNSVLRINNDSALGTSDAGTTVFAGATLQLTGGISVSNEALTLEGEGTGNGSLENLSGNNVWTGNVTLESGVAPSIGVTSGTLTLTGQIDENGSSSLTKVGNGTLILTGTSTYTGETSVNAGTLQLNASADLSSSSQVVVANGAILKGSGTVGAVLVSGAISPGLSPGTMPTGSQTWESGGSYVWEINQANGTQGSDPGWDLLDITGDLTINATTGNEFTIELTTLTLANVAGQMNNFNNGQSYTWTIAAVSGTINGFDATDFTLDASNFANALGGGSFSISQSGGNINLTFTPVPEPHEYAMISALGLAAFGVWRRLRLARQSEPLMDSPKLNLCK
jgi:autotransporter-associated beta strand protein